MQVKIQSVFGKLLCICIYAYKYKPKYSDLPAQGQPIVLHNTSISYTSWVRSGWFVGEIKDSEFSGQYLLAGMW